MTTLDPGDARAAEAALRRQQACDLSELLERRQDDARRHTVWALLGVSPASCLPLVGAATEFGVPVLALGMMVISGTEALRAIRARGEVLELRASLHRLTTPWTSSALRGLRP